MSAAIAIACWATFAAFCVRYGVPMLLIRNHEEDA